MLSGWRYARCVTERSMHRSMRIAALYLPAYFRSTN